MSHDCVTLVRFIADAAVMGERNPSAFADRFEPFFVRRVGREMVGVSFNRQTGGSENFGKALSKITIGEINKIHAGYLSRSAFVKGSLFDVGGASS